MSATTTITQQTNGAILATFSTTVSNSTLTAAYVTANIGIASTVIIVGYSAIGTYAFKNNRNITSVQIPASVKNIEYLAFEGTTKMLDFHVVNTNNLDIIYKSFYGILFKNNGGILTLIQYPIGNTRTTYTVPSAISLISGDVPKAVGVIGIYAFLGASNLTSINISSSVTRIDGGAFRGMTSLVSAVIPQNVTTIGIHLFFGCVKLISVTISKNITSIRIGMFQNAYVLKSVIIPRSVITIEEYAFLTALSLTNITFDIDSHLTTIGQNAFNNTQSLETIRFPASVISIGDSAFVNAIKLTSVTFDKNSQLTSIGQNMFNNAQSLESFTIPPSVATIGTNAFFNSGLKTVYISIPNRAGISVGINKEFYGALGVNVLLTTSLLLDLPSLDSSADNDINATFVGDYTYDNGMGDAQLYTSISVSDMQGIFKFSSNSVLNDIDNATDDLAAVYAYPKLFKDGTEYALSTSIAPADANPSNSSNLLDHATAVGKPYGVATHKFLKKVAVCVFGSELALDMFLNETDIANGYISAINSCITSVNNKFAPDSGDDAKAAAKRIYDAMTSNQSSRFGLKYTAEPGTVPPSQGPHACTASPSTTTASVNIEIAADGSVSNMTLTTPGSGFILGQKIDLTDSDNVVVASIDSINSVQMAMLNGTLDQPTSMPFEANDMFTVMFAVSTKLGQLNVSGDHVSTSTVTRVNIKVVQGP